MPVWFSRMQLQKRILLIVFSSILVVGGALSLECYSIVNRVRAKTTATFVEVKNQNHVAAVSELLKWEVQSWKNLLLRGQDEASNKKYSEELNTVSRDFEGEVQSLMKDLDGGDVELAKHVLEEQRALAAEYKSTAAEFLNVKSFDSRKADERLQGKDRKTSDRLEELTKKLASNVALNSTSLLQDIQNSLYQALAISFVSVMVCGFVVWLVVGVIATRLGDITGNVSSVAETVASASAQIAASSQEFSQASTEQAASLQQTAAAVEELSSMVARSTENSKTSADSAATSQSKVTEGKQIVELMMTSMDDIHSSNAAIMNQITASNLQMSEIVKLIQQIGNQTKVINDIVFQTKLLSFNASVEAARAGEHGKGFAVVAEEVGNLARMSGGAAKEISDMLESSIHRVHGIVEETKSKVEHLVANGQEKIDSGISVARQCGEILTEIQQNVTNVSIMSVEISEACQAQAMGLSEINAAINQLNQVTQTNSSTSAETATSAELLSAQASLLKSSVVELTQTINGHDKGDVAALPAERSNRLPFPTSGKTGNAGYRSAS